MKYVDEYRNIDLARKLALQIRQQVTRPWTIMEICGGQTHAIMKYNLQEFLPDEITLVHGPGCPVCVTPAEKIDRAVELAGRQGIILTSYGDMLRVPGSERDLLTVKAEGGDVRMVYSPLDALRIAIENPEKKVVFFAVGFETTAPANALSVVEARKRKIGNYFMLSSHVLVPPAMEAILSSPGSRIQGFLAAGHVCTIMGYREYLPIAEKFRVPIVITGFEPVDILQGIAAVTRLLESGQASVENQYARAVTREGNLPAQELLKKIFVVSEREWRGIGIIPMSGLQLKPDYVAFDAEKVFSFHPTAAPSQSICMAGKVLQGLMKPNDCPAFGKECTPEHPLGAPMVSSEGACSAYYRYHKTN